eukprot:SAG22_NODE_24150_length_120_cov_48.952381_1_plen_32_part_10
MFFLALAPVRQSFGCGGLASLVCFPCRKLGGA